MAADRDPPPPVRRERSMAEMLRRRGADSADQLAFQYLNSDGSEGLRLSYGDLDRQALSIAAALRKSAGAGERALLLYAPGLDFIPAFFGCLYAGIIAVPAFPPRPDRPWHGVDALSRLVADCQPKLILTGGEYASDIKRMCLATASLAEVDWLNSSDVVAAGRSGWSREAEDSASISHLQYTSGSTGGPKGVVIDHANVMHNEYMIALANGHFETAAAGIYGVSWLPFQHDLGLIAGLLQAVYVGGPLVVLSPLTMLQRPSIWLDAISRYRAHTSAGPNFAYDLCVRRVSIEERASLDLSCWNVAGLGAEPVRSTTIENFTETFAASGFRREAFYPSYGLAEATLMVAGGERCRPLKIAKVSASALSRNEVVTNAATCDVPEETRTLVGCGRPWLEQHIEIVDPASRQRCPAGHVGEIWISGPSVAKGYWKRPVETHEAFNARLIGNDNLKFLRSGDMGFFHDGELYITGRLKDVLIVRGQNHHPQDIEATVQAVDSALKSDAGAVFQVEKDGIEHVVVVQEICRSGKRVDALALRRCIRKAVAEKHGIEVSDVIFVKNSTLPKTTSGKIQRFACRSAYESGRLSIWNPDLMARTPAPS